MPDKTLSTDSNEFQNDDLIKILQNTKKGVLGILAVKTIKYGFIFAATASFLTQRNKVALTCLAGAGLCKVAEKVIARIGDKKLGL